MTNTQNIKVGDKVTIYKTGEDEAITVTIKALGRKVDHELGQDEVTFTYDFNGGSYWHYASEIIRESRYYSMIRGLDY